MKDIHIFEPLLNATSQNEILDFMDRQCKFLGFSCYFYSPIVGTRGSEKLFKEDSQIVEGENLVKQSAFTTYPASWIHRYQEAGHVKVDPVVQQISTSNLPLLWNELNRPAKRKQIVFDEARQHGLVNGITVPVFSQTGERALFSIATDVDPEKSPDHQVVTAGMAVLTALHLHEAVKRVERKGNAVTTPQLTLREKDCLHWAANGKTSWEIASILAISERTVIFHIVNATKKLNTTNRRQAVVRALSLRLISP